MPGICMQKFGNSERTIGATLVDNKAKVPVRALAV
jgi:hypothetical protein